MAKTRKRALVNDMITNFCQSVTVFLKQNFTQITNLRSLKGTPRVEQKRTKIQVFLRKKI